MGKNMENMLNLVGTAFLGMILMSILNFLIALFIWPAWNYVMPELVGLGTLTYMKTWCLITVIAGVWKITPFPYPKKD